MNLNQVLTMTGRLTKDVISFDNKDGSKKVKFTLAVSRNYKDKDGVRPTDFIPFDAFVSKDVKGLGVFDYVAKGDMVSLSFEMRNEKYEKDGQTIYKIVNHVTGVELRETKKSKDMREINQAVSETEVDVDPTEVPFE